MEKRISYENLDALQGLSYEIDECLEGPIDYSWLTQAVNVLPSDQLTVLEKIFWDGFTIREVGQFLGLSRSTAQRLKIKALSALYAKIWDTRPFIRGDVEFLLPDEGRKSAA